MAQAQAAAVAAVAAVSAAAIAGAEDEPPDTQQQQQQQLGITDAACLPSSLLLRDLHMGLMRLMDGSGPKAGKRGLRPPPAARFCPTDSQRQLQALMSGPHWAQRAAQVVQAAGPLVTGPDPQDAAKQLLESDYALLPLAPRLALLRCLTDFAFVSELARAHLAARSEAFTQSRTTGRPGFAASTFSATQPPGVTGFEGATAAAAAAAGAGVSAAEGARRAEVAAAEHASAVRMLEEWVDWLECHSHQAALVREPIPTIGLRRPLGVDARHRRYWVLGGAAGAWRVYCEEGDSSNWGYYEGRQLLALVSWLAAAALEAEGPLLAALCCMPWPYKPDLVARAAQQAAAAAAAVAHVPAPHSPTSLTYWSGFASGHAHASAGAGAGGVAGGGAAVVGFTPSQAGVQPAGQVLDQLGMRLPHPRQLMRHEQLQRHRPNGYLGFVAPMLYGEADIPGGSVLSSSTERLRLGFDCLMAQVPFWLAGQEQVVTQMAEALTHLQSVDAGAYTQALAILGEAMSSSSLGVHSPLDEDWHTTWQQQWQASLAGCRPPSWEAVGLHLSLLGRHVVPRGMRMSREAFLGAVEVSRCKLVFPAVGEEVCLVRSGCLLHLRHYAQLPDASTAPLPPAAAELNAAAEVVRRLPPVSRYKVLAVAYCQYPKPQPRPAQQQQQQLQQQEAAGQGPAATSQQPGGSMAQQQQQQQDGLSKSGSKKSSSKSPSPWGFGFDDEEGSGDEEERDEYGSDSGDEEFDRGVRLTGIDSDADGLTGASRQQQSASQPLQQQQASQQQWQQQPNGTADQAPGGQQQQQQQQEEAPVQQRPPCMWLLLSPVGNGSIGSSGSNGGQAGSSAPAAPPGPAGGQQPELDDLLGDFMEQQQPEQDQQQQQRLPCVAVPLHVDGVVSLPAYLVNPALYEACLQRRWLPQDRCSMYIGSRQRAGGAVSSGDYAQGSIIEIEEPLPGEDYDPWQSITVLWDDEWRHLDLRSKVSPWDVDTDFEERLRQEEAARKAAAAAAAAEELARQEAAAEAARQKRRQNQRARLDQIGDIGVGAAERDDDDDYNPEDDSSDSEGGRRGRKGRLSKQQQQQQPAVPSQQQQFSQGGGEAASRKRGRGAAGRGRGAGLTWSGRGGRAGGPGGPLAPPAGAAWTRAQIEAQQMMHLNSLQQAMAAAMATGNTSLLAQLTAGAGGGQQLPTPLPLDLLAEMPAQLEFLLIVVAYNNSREAGFVPPVVNNRELDLYTLFMVVNVRGGYEAVCTSCRWPDVCKSLGCDQGVATARDMRISYERALLDFEQYVRSGRYKREREADQAPLWLKADRDAAIEQAMRAGKAAVAAQSAPASVAPRAAAAATQRGALPLLPGAAAAGAAAGLMGLPAGLNSMPLLQQNQAVAIAQAQIAAQLRLQQQAQLLAAQKAGTPAGVAAAGARPAQAAVQQPQALSVLQQQHLVRQQLLQQQLLQASGNPQLQALLLQQHQQQAQLAAAGAMRPLGAAGVLTPAHIQQLQQLSQARPAGVGLPQAAALPGAAGTGVAAAARLPAAAGASAGNAQGLPAASQELAGSGSVKFSALLDGL